MTCKLCDSEKLVAKGLCSKHYNQQRYQQVQSEPCIIDGCDTKRNGNLKYCGFHYKSLRMFGDPLARGMPGEYCKRGHKDGWIVTASGQRRCRECDREHDRRRNQKPERKRYNRNKNLLRDYGITLEQFEDKWQTQNGQCAICCGDLEMGKGGHAVDHDHTSGLVRGLLCKPCNNGLGHLQDSVEVLRSALRYLSYYKSELEQEEPN